MPNLLCVGQIHLCIPILTPEGSTISVAARESNPRRSCTVLFNSRAFHESEQNVGLPGGIGRAWYGNECTSGGEETGQQGGRQGGVRAAEETVRRLAHGRPRRQTGRGRQHVVPRVGRRQRRRRNDV